MFHSKEENIKEETPFDKASFCQWPATFIFDLHKIVLVELPHPVYACAFSTLCCVLELTYVGFHRHIWTNISNSKMKCKVKNASVNGTCTVHAFCALCNTVSAVDCDLHERTIKPYQILLYKICWRYQRVEGNFFHQ